MTLSTLIARSVDLIPWKLRNHVRAIPIVAGCQRWLLDRFMQGEEFVHVISAGPAKGLKFPIHLPEDKLFWTGTWEQAVTTAIAASVRPGEICCDIGSHRGFIAGVMACAGARLVYCIEPNPANVERLRLVQRLNPEFDIRVIEAAIGGRNGEAEFFLMPEASMGKLASSSFQLGMHSLERLCVQVRTLDSLLEEGEIEAPGFIKIDIEGAEFEALSGARMVISRHRPSLLIELHSSELARRCRSFLGDFGYGMSFVEPDLDPERDDDFRICHMLARSR